MNSEQQKSLDYSLFTAQAALYALGALSCDLHNTEAFSHVEESRLLDQIAALTNSILVLQLRLKRNSPLPSSK